MMRCARVRADVSTPRGGTRAYAADACAVLRTHAAALCHTGWDVGLGGPSLAFPRACPARGGGHQQARDRGHAGAGHEAARRAPQLTRGAALSRAAPAHAARTAPRCVRDEWLSEPSACAAARTTPGERMRRRVQPTRARDMARAGSARVRLAARGRRASPKTRREGASGVRRGAACEATPAHCSRHAAPGARPASASWGASCDAADHRPLVLARTHAASAARAAQASSSSQRAQRW